MTDLYAVFTDFRSYDEYLDSIELDYVVALMKARELATGGTMIGSVSVVRFAPGSRPWSGRAVDEIPVTFDSEEDYS